MQLMMRIDEECSLAADESVLDLALADHPDVRRMLIDVLVTLASEGQDQRRQVAGFTKYLIEADSETAGLLGVEVAHRIKDTDALEQTMYSSQPYFRENIYLSEAPSWLRVEVRKNYQPTEIVKISNSGIQSGQPRLLWNIPEFRKLFSDDIARILLHAPSARAAEEDFKQVGKRFIRTDMIRKIGVALACDVDLWSDSASELGEGLQ